MNEPAFLLACAQIAIVFAGFASVVSVLHQQSTAEDPRVNTGRMEIMIAVGLGTVLLALFPFIPLRAGLSLERAWTLSGGLLVAGAGALAWHTYSRYRRAWRAGIHTLTGVPYYGLYAIVAGCGALAVSGALSPGAREAAYMAGVYLLLGVAGFAFYRITRSIFRFDVPDD